MTQARDLADGKFDTNTLVVDAANNHVGVGTASPSLPLHINGASAGDGLVYSRSGTEYFRIDDTGTDMNIKTTGGGHQIIFTTNSSEVGRWRNGGGLTFNGDTAAANALDDYEEGTWTPTDATSSGVTISLLRAGYVKIGNLVHVHFYANTFGSSGVTAGAKIGGLPYTNVANGWTCTLVQTAAGQISSQDIAARIPAGEAAVDFKGASLDTSIAWSHFNGTYMIWQMSYHVS